YSPDPTARQPQVYVYGEGSAGGKSGSGTFLWAQMFAQLAEPSDVGGGVILDRNALGPMGARAAFPPRASGAIVDITTGTSDRIDVPGDNIAVSWLADGRHVLVSSRTRTWLVNVDAHTAIPAAATGPAVTPLVGGGSSLTTLTASASDTEP